MPAEGALSQEASYPLAVPRLHATSGEPFPRSESHTTVSRGESAEANNDIRNLASPNESGTRRYYDALAADYDRTVHDWRGAVIRQGDALSSLLRERLGRGTGTLLDCACGIGTQSIGLALQGYTVLGTDTSSVAISRAMAEADAFGAEVSFAVADMRELSHEVPGEFDAVICCDNSLAHMLTEEDLRRALAAMCAKLRPGGVLLISLRDYDRHREARPPATVPICTQDQRGERVTFQRWYWLNEQVYRADLFLIERDGRDGWTTTEHAGPVYRAWPRSEVEAIATSVGAVQASWLLPEVSGYHQPLMSVGVP